MNPQIVGKYKCRLCQFSSDRKHNYISHLKSKKHKKNQQEQQISIPAHVCILVIPQLEHPLEK